MASALESWPHLHQPKSPGDPCLSLLSGKTTDQRTVAIELLNLLILSAGLRLSKYKYTKQTACLFAVLAGSSWGPKVLCSPL